MPPIAKSKSVIRVTQQSTASQIQKLNKPAEPAKLAKPTSQPARQSDSEEEDTKEEEEEEVL